MTLPVWALKGKALNKWRRLYAIELSGTNAQVLFCDYSEPVAVMFLRPLNLSKEGRTIMGTFRLDDDEAKIHEWVVGRYVGAAQAFVVSATPMMMKYLLTHVRTVTWFDVDGRERVKKLLDQHERNTSWTSGKLQSTQSLQEPSGWESISSPSLEKVEAAKAS